MPILVRALLIAAVGALLPLAAFASSYDEGVRLYKAGEFERASALLRRAAVEEPGNAAAHYYLANSLVRIQEHEAAIDEYRAGYALDPGGAVGEYCGRALRGYRARLPNAAETKAWRDTTGGAESRPGRTVVGAEQGQVEPAGDAQHPLKRSVRAIRRQVAYEKKQTEHVSEATAADAISAAHNTVKNINDSAEQQIQRLYAPTARQNAITPEEASAREAQIRRAAKAEEEYVLRQGQLKAERYRRIGEMKQTALDQVADNLEQQLSDDGKYSGVRLLPQGTNLYVRSYASAPPVRALPEVHAAVARIYAQAGPGGNVQSDSAAADKANASSYMDYRNVHGKILKKPN